MGCGFSKAKKRTKDEDDATEKAAKKKPKRKKTRQRNTEAASSPPPPEIVVDQVAETEAERRRSKSAFANRPELTDGTIQVLTEVSASQVDFFKMLDEKIDQGFPSSSPFAEDIEDEAEFISMDLTSKSRTSSASSTTIIGSVHAVTINVVQANEDDENGLDSDSLKTAYSNSINLPFEALLEAESSSPSTASSPRPPEPLPEPSPQATPFFSETTTSISVDDLEDE